MSEWMISINNNFDKSSVLRYNFYLVLKQINPDSSEGSLSTGAAPVSAVERNINWRKYLMATLTVSPWSLLKLHLKREDPDMLSSCLRPRSRPRGYDQAPDWHVTRDRHFSLEKGPDHPTLSDSWGNIGCGDLTRLPQHCRDVPDIRHRRRRERRWRRRG